MQKRNHIILGIFLVMGFLLILGWLNLNLVQFSALSVLSIAGITLFYSLLPDIDHKNSTITWWFFGIGVLGLAFGMFCLGLNINILNAWTLMILSTVLLVFTYLAVNLFEHRGVIHSVPVGILAAIPLYFVFYNFMYCLLAYIAWHSHLIGDGYLFKLK